MLREIVELALDDDLRNYRDTPERGNHAKSRAATALRASLFKKFKDDIDPVLPDDAAWKEFHRCNALCATWSLKTELLGPMDEYILGELKDILWKFFNPNPGETLLNRVDIERNLDFGPGSSPGMADTSFLGKLGHSVLTSPNPLVIELYYEWVADKDSRIDMEIRRCLELGPPEVTRCVRVTSVLKNQQVSRLVKPEPLLGMFYQKGAGAILESRLKEFFGIDLTVQPQLNRLLAEKGSVDRSIATIDLHSASDLLARKMLKTYIDPENFGWLDNLRSTGFIDRQGNECDLAMMACMGNGFIFPLQTVLDRKSVV